MRDLLCSVYDLTAAEAELAALLCEGETLAAAADFRGVKLNTARTQLKQVFSKTRTNRQAELVESHAARRRGAGGRRRGPTSANRRRLPRPSSPLKKG